MESFAHFSDGTSVPADGVFHNDPLNPMVAIRCIEPWLPNGVSKIIAGGNTAMVGLLNDEVVLKYPMDRLDLSARKCLDIEDQILSALGDHKRIVKYLGKMGDGLLFQRAVNGDVRQYMADAKPGTICNELRLKWSRQAAQAVEFIHSRGVIHCDIHPSNFLLDDQLNVLLCDFAGSLLGNLDGEAMESTRFFLPRDPLTTPTERTDLFALGSTMYWILAGHEPYDTLSEDEVTACFVRNEFPNVDTIVRGRTILGCWEGRFSNAQEVVHELC